MTAFTDHARNDAIYARRAAGDSFNAIARQFGISRERVRQILKSTGHRHHFQALGINVRMFNALVNMGVLEPEDYHTLTRDQLLAKLATVDLADVGAQKNCGVRTLHALAAVLGRAERYRQRGTGVVRIDEHATMEIADKTGRADVSPSVQP